MKYSYLEFLKNVHETVAPKVYLEIGVRDGSSLSLSRCKSIAVDPHFNIQKEIRCECHLFRMTSDDLDLLLGNDKLDIAFIDGMHLSEYAFRDILNTMRYSKKNTIILMDDVIPYSMDITTREQLPGGWTGDVYKTIVSLKHYAPELELITIDTKPSGLALLTNIDPRRDEILWKNSNEIQTELAGSRFEFTDLNVLRSYLDPVSMEKGIDYIKKKMR